MPLQSSGALLSYIRQVFVDELGSAAGSRSKHLWVIAVDLHLRSRVLLGQRP